MEDSDPRPRGAQPRGRPRRGGPRARSHRARVPAPGVAGAGGGGEGYFVNSVGFGCGPEVVRAGTAMPGLSGSASSFVPVVGALAGYRPQRFEVGARGFPKPGYMMMMEVCKGTTAGGSY